MRVLVQSSHKIRLEALELLVQAIGFKLFSAFEQFSGPTVVLSDLISAVAPYPDARQIPTLALVSTDCCPHKLEQLGYLGWVGAEASSVNLRNELKKIESILEESSKNNWLAI